jgi:transcriptional regulator with XRE-family HTH domain
MIHARMKNVVMPTDASALRLRVGAELRRLREAAHLSGEQVAATLGWSQPKVSRIETGRTAFTVRDAAQLLALYGVTGDVRAELLAATAEDTGESAWIVRAGGFPRRQDSIASLEVVTKRIRQYQPVLVPGLLQTHEYAQTVAAAAGAIDPAAIAAARMQRQDLLKGKDAPTFDVVLDARALLCRVGPVDVLRNQILHLVERAQQGTVNLNVIPLGAEYDVLSNVGFTIFDFRFEDSPSVVWVESPAGDVYFSAPDDIERHATLFRRLQGVAFSVEDTVSYLPTLVAEVERYAEQVAPRR